MNVLLTVLGGAAWVLSRLGLDGTAAALSGMAVTVVLRMLARHYRWNLPKAEEE